MREDPQWTTFLQWALPQLHLRWPGFRKVRTQVRKRVQRRIRSLHLAGPGAYRRFLLAHPEEWLLLDTLCRITISRFYRDRGVQELLADRIIPGLANRARQTGNAHLRIWSAGCSSGEEPYTLVLLWAMQLQQRYPDIRFQVLATDIDAQLLNRARTACYPFSSLKALPAAWRESAFSSVNGHYCLQPAYKDPVLFVEHDIRDPLPATNMHLILCRNLVYTYFETELQREITQRLLAALQPGGLLVLGSHEVLPGDDCGFLPWSRRQGIYIKPGDVIMQSGNGMSGPVDHSGQ